MARVPHVLVLVAALLGSLVVASPAAAATTLGAPSEVMAAPLPGGAQITWVRPTVAGYPHIVDDIRYTATADPGSASCTATGNDVCSLVGLTTGVAYTFSVIATDVDGSSPPSPPSAPMVARVDVAPPSIDSGTVTPARLPISGGEIQIAVRISDEGVGVDPASPRAHLAQGDRATDPLPLVLTSGDAHDGVYTATTTIPPGSGGTWQLVTDSVEDVAGNLAWTASADRLQVGIPLAPTDVRVEARPGRMVRVFWTPPPADTGLPLTGFSVGVDSPADPVVDPSSTWVDLDPGDVRPTSVVRYVVHAVDAAGSSPASDWSNALSVPAGAPAAPAAPKLTVGRLGDGWLSWAPPASDHGSSITGYTVEADPGGVVCTTATTFCGIGGIPAGTTTRLSITATNAIGTGPAVDAGSYRPPAAPSAVVGPRFVTERADGRVLVSWRGIDWNGLTGVIRVSAGQNGPECTSTTDSCSLTGLRVGRSYLVAIAPQSFAGPGPITLLTVTPAGVPASVRPLRTRSFSRAVRVSWSAPQNDGAAITRYRVVIARGSTTRTLTVDARHRSVVAHGLHSGERYTVGVQALNRWGWSAVPARQRIRAK